MNGNFLRSQGLLAVAVGAGVVIGATGLFLYEHLFKEKRRLILQQDVSELGICVSQLRRELEEIRDAQRRTRRIIRSVRERTSSTLNEAENETISAEDEFDDEFFDLSDTEDLSSITKVENAELDVEQSKYSDIDELFSGSPGDKTKVLGQLMDMSEQEPDNPEILWRLAKAYHNMAIVMESEGDATRHQDYIAKGLECATRCLDLNPRSADAHKWYAICIGGRSQFQGTKDKLKDGVEFRKHVEEALKLKPDDPTLHHLLGRFKYEVASLTWVERKVAGTLFGEVPYSTYPEAAESLCKADELSTTPWKENRLLLAKAYLKMQDYPAFMKWLELADKVEVLSREDREAETEIKALQKMALQRGLAETL
uniref:Regulator of microtubule dynamics protein 1 n=1 Tax=Panstrongylus lignarius TaxID=156445 RepID=A0A224XIM9_9HEMI